jgi:hypothetical protein
VIFDGIDGYKNLLWEGVVNVSDKFDDFLNRLEMPLSEPVIVTMADKAVEAQIACVRCAGVLIQHTIRSVLQERRNRP